MKQQKQRQNNVVYRTVDISHFGFLSHMPVLTAACMMTTGPVLELGAGFGSSLALHGICASSKRYILTLESSKTWMYWFRFYNRSWHKFKFVENFIDLPEYKEKWGLAFVDHGILGERGLALSQLRHVPIIVAHDTCYEELNYTNDGIPQVLSSFKYRYDHQWQGPKTSVLSDYIDVKTKFMEIGL